jgi:phosphate starvation-inducible PhoH-like protein
VKLVTREDWLKIEAPEEPLALAEEFFAFLNAARSQGMTIRTPDFARLVDSFAKGEAGRLAGAPRRAPRHRHQPQERGPEDHRPEGIPPVGPQAADRVRDRARRHGQDLPGDGGGGLGAPQPRGAADRPDPPAVEAGEALGFLPGDLREKILPYLRPLYDALHDMLDPEEVVKLTEKGIIEIAPLAYMRGRTLRTRSSSSTRRRTRRPSR